MMADIPAEEIDTSHDRLTHAAYATDKDLAARQSLYSWQVPSYDMPAIVATQIEQLHGALVDVGCGNGWYVNALRQNRPDLNIIGLDLSPGILAGVAPPLIVADAMHLPFGDNRIDGLLAMHMIYHLPDIEAGIRELARILRPPGLLIASTNGADDKSELDQLWSSAAADVLGTSEGPRRISLSSRFPLSNAPALLGKHFSHVSVTELPGTITVTQPEPVIAHLRSYRAWADQTGVPFDATLERASQRLTDHLHSSGRFTVTCHGGILVCQGVRD